MSIAGNFNASIASFNKFGNQLVVSLDLTNAEDGTLIENLILYCPLNGTDPIIDSKGRTVASATPTNIRNNINTIITNIQSAIDSAITQSKILL